MIYTQMMEKFMVQRGRHFGEHRHFFGRGGMPKFGWNGWQDDNPDEYK
jgi:hypothetical protein